MHESNVNRIIFNSTNSKLNSILICVGMGCLHVSCTLRMRNYLFSDRQLPPPPGLYHPADLLSLTLAVGRSPRLHRPL